MFEWALARLVDSKVDDVMTSLSDALAAVEDLNPTTSEVVCMKARTAIADIPNLNLLGAKRTVMIGYRGRRCKHVVTSTEDEIQRRKMSEAKGRVVQNGILIPMVFEEDLVDGWKSKYDKAGFNFKSIKFSL
jgi:hypothetical protein